MPKISVSRSHTLDMEEAKRRIEKIGNDLEQKHGLKGNWRSADTYEFKRTGVSGKVRLSDGRVDVDVDLSMLLSPLKDKIRQKLEEGLERELA